MQEAFMAYIFTLGYENILNHSRPKNFIFILPLTFLQLLIAHTAHSDSLRVSGLII